MITWNPTDMADAASDTLAVHDLLARFFQAFDDHDWSMMRSCLCDELFVIYSSDRKVPASTISADRYVDQRRGALKGFVMQHNFFNLRVELDAAGRSATARCNYVIHRFSSDGGRHTRSVLPFLRPLRLRIRQPQRHLADHTHRPVPPAP